MDEKTLFSEAIKMINYIGINYIGRNIQNPYMNKTIIPERHKRLKSLVLAQDISVSSKISIKTLFYGATQIDTKVDMKT